MPFWNRWTMCSQSIRVPFNRIARRSGRISKQSRRSVIGASLPPQVFYQHISFFDAHIEHVHVVPQARRRAVAGADALGELQRDLTVGRRFAAADAELLFAMPDQFIRTAQHARQSATDP